MAQKKSASASAFLRSGAKRGERTKKKIGRPRTLVVKLKPREQRQLNAMLRRGRESARVFRRAQVLQMLDAGQSVDEIAEVLGASKMMVREAGKRYIAGGLQRVLWDAPRPGKKRVLNETQEQQLVAVLCGPSPSGRARWTIRAATAEVIKQGIVATIGRETVRRTMKRHDLKPWREKNVVRSKAGRGVY